MKRLILAAMVAASLAGATSATTAEGIVIYKSLDPDVAFDLARAALQQCRKDGYQVAVVVMDRFGRPLVTLRDRFAGVLALELANGKAWTAVNFARNTSDLIDAIKSGEMNPATATLPKVTMLSGGLIVEAGGSLLGSVGVAGALGGARDEACAKTGIAAVRDRLDF
jgi:uncharacterized protein GlcG (DUF336 family)